MNPTCVELSLSLKPSYVPKSLSSLLLDLSRIDDEYYKLSVLSDYICKHEQELTRVESLKHQLPQGRLLLMEAIETLKEEFLNIKNNLQTKAKNKEERENYEIACGTTDEDYARKHKTSILDNNFQGSYIYKESTWNSIGSSSSSGKEREAASIDESWRDYNNQGFMLLKTNQPEPLTQPIWKNNRRRWSSQLHSRFLEVLNMLGGIEVATPKQVRDLMKVEGLTIDQVKSHLQKYRLHCGKAG